MKLKFLLSLLFESGKSMFQFKKSMIKFISQTIFWALTGFTQVSVASSEIRVNIELLPNRLGPRNIK